MAKQVKIKDDVYGTMIFDNENDIWKVKDKVIIPINNRKCKVTVEIDVFDSLYVNQKYELFDKEILEFHKKHPELLKEDEAIECENKQREIYKKLMVNNLNDTVSSIERAALQELEEILTDEPEKYLVAEVGKEKVNKLLSAKTQEERLESLVLKRMRVFRDRIEITCTCDWYKHSGGFSINSDGYAVMLSLDCMSI